MRQYEKGYGYYNLTADLIHGLIEKQADPFLPICPLWGRITIDINIGVDMIALRRVVDEDPVTRAMMEQLADHDADLAERILDMVYCRFHMDWIESMQAIGQLP